MYVTPPECGDSREIRTSPLQPVQGLLRCFPVMDPVSGRRAKGECHHAPHERMLPQIVVVLHPHHQTAEYGGHDAGTEISQGIGSQPRLAQGPERRQHGSRYGKAGAIDQDENEELIEPRPIEIERLPLDQRNDHRHHQTNRSDSEEQHTEERAEDGSGNGAGESSNDRQTSTRIDSFSAPRRGLGSRGARPRSAPRER